MVDNQSYFISYKRNRLIKRERVNSTFMHKKKQKLESIGEEDNPLFSNIE
jgi:hypothetical protein